MERIKRIEGCKNRQQYCRTRSNNAAKFGLVALIIGFVLLFTAAAIQNLSVSVEIAPNDLFKNFRKSAVPFDNTKNLTNGFKL